MGIMLQPQAGPPMPTEPQTGVVQEEPIAEDMPTGVDPVWARSAEGVYGPLFPLLSDDPSVHEDGAWWRVWGEDLWTSVQTVVQRPVWLALRNRELRRGNHWLDSRGYGPWSAPAKAPGEVRAVWNMIGPALDCHDEVCAEQRPGFRVTPRVLTPDAMKQAEGQQQAGEYQYDEQKMPSHLKEWRYWAGTDGVCFPMVGWDPSRGPDYRFMDGSSEPLGDPFPMCFTIEQVRVSPGATANIAPVWWVIREEIPLLQAIAQHGPDVAEEYQQLGVTRWGHAKATFAEKNPSKNIQERGGLAGWDGEVIDRWTVFCEPVADLLPEGLMVVTVGDVLVHPPSALPFKKVPIFRFTDGSHDPAFYCEPRMNQWVEHQMQVNVGVSKWIESLRRQANGQMAVKAGMANINTLMAGLMRIIEVDTPGPIGESIQVLPGISIAPDLVNFITLAIKGFEDRSGWNDVARGQFASGTSGRAILAVREQLERAFAPGVNAASEAMCKWLELTLGWMGWGYDVPRTVALTGTSRIDLALELHRTNFQPVGLVKVDPESMMPLPRALRLFILEDALGKGIISREEYRRRYPYATLQNMETPDTDHHARAKRVVSAIKRTVDGEQGVMIPEVLWMDDEAIHQDVLQRELILPDDVHPQARMIAYQRWMQLANQAMMKMGPMMGAPGGAPAPSPGGGGGAAPKLSPRTQPLLGTSPGMSVAPMPRAT